jgi:hypothetical protein
VAAQSSVRGRTLKSNPANAFGPYDSTPFAFVDINHATKEDLVALLGLSPRVADRIIAWRSTQPIRTLDDLRAVRGLPESTFSRIEGSVLLPGDLGLHVLDLTARDDYIFSSQPFVLRVSFVNPAEAPVAIASVTVLWAGAPFVVEQELTTDDRLRGYIDVEFDSDRALPVGRAEFRLAMYRLDGAQASFRKTFYVLPSNPLSLSLSPAGATVTGTWSARGVYESGPDRFVTECTITVANGAASAVNMNKLVTWQFWNGGVGGTSVESGSFSWPGSITVPAFGVWQGGVRFSSPRGSGIYNTYRAKEDMTIEIVMIGPNNVRVSGTITCRVMLAYGVNIIKVGDFGSQEGFDLYDAVDVTRQIYERRDITFRGVQRWIIHDADAGSYRIINSEGEVYDLFDDWSVANTFIDVYVCQDFLGTGFDGLAGDIPGPAAKGSDRDGVAVDKTGYLSGSVKRLRIDYLGMLIGHEVGHYLGLPHIGEPDNLMLSNSGETDTDLNYDQYQLMAPHGFVVFI